MSIFSVFPNELNEIRSDYQSIEKAINNINRVVKDILPEGKDKYFDEILICLGSATDDLDYWIDEQI